MLVEFEKVGYSDVMADTLLNFGRCYEEAAVVRWHVLPRCADDLGD
jgi:hypothetical protein